MDVKPKFQPLKPATFYENQAIKTTPRSYFPIQNLEKIAPKISLSTSISPVIVPKL
mgnify:CR=1 FL=1